MSRLRSRFVRTVSEIQFDGITSSKSSGSANSQLQVIGSGERSPRASAGLLEEGDGSLIGGERSKSSQSGNGSGSVHLFQGERLRKSKTANDKVPANLREQAESARKAAKGRAASRTGVRAAVVTASPIAGYAAADYANEKMKKPAPSKGTIKLQGLLTSVKTKRTTPPTRRVQKAQQRFVKPLRRLRMMVLRLSPLKAVNTIQQIRSNGSQHLQE
jgi:hypothetical protein